MKASNCLRLLQQTGWGYWSNNICQEHLEMMELKHFNKRQQDQNRHNKDPQANTKFQQSGLAS